MLTGEPFAAALPEKIDSWQQVLEIGLRMEREILIPRLENRVRRMWEEGLVQEVENLIQYGLRESKTAAVAIGYAQALAQLDGEIDQETAIESTTRLTQRYARRQVSWFKRDDRIQWLDALDPDLSDKAFELVSNSGLLAGSA
jgi:tRNA dimethylallyltransferase